MVADEDSAHAHRRAAGDAVERELSVLFRRARSLSLTLAARLHPDLDAAAYGLLVFVADSEPVRAAELAERFGLDKSTVSRQLAQLESLELIERVADPTDGRARLVQLTANGRTRLVAVRAERRQRFWQSLSDWETEDIRALSELLGKLNEDL
ncbi:MarR family winged helix-turn-helix transcriptional regulator [Allokutzneria oryzae]|uniref:MarR family winged helix-turn-helix transcriptional regulator n=1 Tax=Allokutzneria oryzae TaxID=1378989 RepID=A0ABV6A108_9PSEU